MQRKRGVIFGTGLGALIAAGIIGITAAAIYLQIRNQSELALIEAPARSMAQALAQEVSRVQGDPALVQAFVTHLQKQQVAQTLHLAAVVTEPKSFKYRFLRQRRYLAHTRPAQIGRALDKGSSEDKSIYDLANQVRQQGALNQASLQLNGGTTIQSAAPIQFGGKYQAMALVRTEPSMPPAPFAAWPLGMGIIICCFLGMFAGVIVPRFRYGVVLVTTLGFGFFCYWILSRLTSAYGENLHAVYQALATELKISTQTAHPSALPSLRAWPLLTGIGAGIAVAILGAAGVGKRLVAGWREHRSAYAYIIPAALGMLVLVFIPFGYGLGLGFFDHAHGTYTYVGLKNFIEILSGGGRPLSHPLNFYFTLGVTALWTTVNVVLHVGIGLLLALVLKDPLLHFKGIYRVLLILPWAVPNYITALIWKGMFHYEYGAVNHMLSLLGIERVSWFSQFSTSFTANVVTNTWLGFPFMMVICLGAMQSIPRDVYEAAEVDGASKWQAFWRITMPLLRPALFPAIVLGSIWTFNMFNIIYLVSGGEPGGSTDILITEAYRWAFERADRYGLAAAYALIIFVILLAYTVVANRLARATEDVLE